MRSAFGWQRQSETLPTVFGAVAGAQRTSWKQRDEKRGAAGLRADCGRVEDRAIRVRILPEIVSLILRIRGRASLYGAVPVASDRATALVTLTFHRRLSLHVFHRASRSPCLAEEDRPGPETTGCTSAGSMPLCPTGREASFPAWEARVSALINSRPLTKRRDSACCASTTTTTPKTAIDFLREVQEHFPFAIQKIRDR